MRLARCAVAANAALLCRYEKTECRGWQLNGCQSLFTIQITVKMNPSVIISDMVCRHCVSAVKGALDRTGIGYEAVEIGKVYLKSALTAAQTATLDAELAALGFRRIDSDEDAIVEAAKHAVMHHVRDEAECRLKLSACIEAQLGMSYAAVSRLFSQHEGRTIEKYHQAQKVERVKELLQQGRRSLDEIAEIVGYSSGAHLSRRFKDVTGMTPSEYVRIQPPRISLDEV